MSIELGAMAMKPQDVAYVKYASDFQSFVDVALISAIIYATTEFYYGFCEPQDEINLSVLWCACIIGYSISTLVTITMNYMRSAEGSVCICVAGISFIASLLIQMADTKLFAFNLKKAFVNFTIEAYNFMNSTHMESFNTTINVTRLQELTTYSHNELIFTFFLAFLSSIVGALFFFPSFRLANMHLLAMKYNEDSRIKRFMLNVSFILPLLVALCWLKIGVNSKVPLSSVKFYLVIAVFVSKLALFKSYVQAYLNSAIESVHFLKRSGTKLTNLKYINAVVAVFKYYGVVVNQYVVPAFMLLFLAFLTKTLGELSWCELELCQQVVAFVKNYTVVPFSFNRTQMDKVSLFKNFESAAFSPHAFNDIKQVFSPFLFESIIGYFTFWTAIVWFALSCFGLVYYQYMDTRHVIYQS